MLHTSLIMGDLICKPNHKTTYISDYQRLFICKVNHIIRFAYARKDNSKILQVHDELNFSVYPNEAEQVERIVIEEMQGAYSLSVPLMADAGWGDNWLEAH